MCFKLNSYQWRFYPADLIKGQLFENFGCISFGKGWLFLDLTLRVKQCSIYLGKIRPNWHGWLYCVFVANARVNIPTFWLPIEKRYVSPQPHSNFTLFFSDLYLLAMIASRLSIVTSRVTTRPSSLPIISWSCSTLSSKDSWPSPKISCKWWTWSILKQWIGWKFCLR